MSSEDNYYKILNVAENATQEKIAMVYYVGLKRLNTMKQDKPHLSDYIDQAIARLRQAYQTLSDPQFRAAYDDSLKEGTLFSPPTLYTPPCQQVETTPTYQTIPELKRTLAITEPILLGKEARDHQQKSRRTFLSVLILTLCIIAGASYFAYPLLFPPKIEVAPKPNIAAKNTTNAEFKASLNEKLKQAALLKQLNAHNPQLKAIAYEVAKAANTKLNAVINNTMQFVGAKASNQNITYRFVVFDSITNSQEHLLSFFTERFISDSNEVCNNQQTHLSNGILFTLAYFNTKGELVGSYYIDQQVCTIRPQKLIKKPDINQLNSVEIPLPETKE